MFQELQEATNQELHKKKVIADDKTINHGIYLWLLATHLVQQKNIITRPTQY